MIFSLASYFFFLAPFVHYSSARYLPNGRHRGNDCETYDIQWVDCAQNPPARLQATLNGTEGSLPSTLSCGRLEVPLDYAKPMSHRNKITISLSLYTPSSPKGTIFFNPGGPGEEAQSFAWRLALNQTEIFSGLEDYQWMMMDTRGTHGSSPLNCSAEAYSEIPNGPPVDEAEFRLYKEKSRTFAQSCRDQRDSFLHIGSQETIEDWERVRIALGKQKISLLGVSYGTYWFAEYVERYPHSIERAALDAVTSRGRSDVENIIDEITAVNRMLLRADAFCQATESCPFRGEGKGSVVKAWETLLGMAEAGDLVAKACLDEAASCSPEVTPDIIRTTVPTLLRSTPLYETLMTVLALALGEGDASGLLIPDQISQAFSTAIPLFCPDDKIDGNNFKAFQNIFEATRKVDTADLQYSLVWQGKLACSGWPISGRPKSTLRAKHFPFLWVASDFDLNTPIEWAKFNYESTPKSTLVVRHGDGHGSMTVRGPARDTIIEYLRTGKVSPSSNETLSSVYPPGSKLPAVMDPYAVGFGAAEGVVDVLQ